MGFKDTQHKTAALACPMAGFKPCRNNCAWYKGGECALYLLHGELFALVEVTAGGTGHLPQGAPGHEEIILERKADADSPPWTDEGEAQRP